jgi:hypothetical protein
MQQRWDGHMTSAARTAFDAFLKLQHRRLGGVPPNPTDAMHHWSELSLGCLAHVHDDLEYIPALWRLTNAAMVALEKAGSVNPASLYLQWHCTANMDDAANAAVSRSVELGVNVDWTLLVLIVHRRIFIGDLSGAGQLVSKAASVLRARQALTPAEETCVADITSLYADPFTNAAEFAQWRQRANQLVYDARYVLGEAKEGEDERSPTSVLKLLLLDMLTFAAGDRALLEDRARALGMSAMWFVGGVAAVILPFASWSELHAACKAYNTRAAPWLLHVVEAILAIAAPQDVVTAAATLLELLPTDATPHCRFAAHLMAANVADIAAAPFAATGARGRTVALRNQLVTAFARELSAYPPLWRVAAMYLVYSPMNDPAILAQHLKAAAPENEQAVQDFIREHVDRDAPFQTALRRALYQRIPTTMSEKLDGVMAHFDLTLEAADVEIRSRHAVLAVAAGHLSHALADWIDLGDNDAIIATLSERLTKWAVYGDVDPELVACGIAANAGLVVATGLAPQADRVIRASAALADLIPFASPAARAARRATAEQISDAATAASHAAKLAAEAELAEVTLRFAIIALECAEVATPEGTALLLDLHGAVAAAGAVFVKHGTSDGGELVSSVQRRLHALAKV